MNQLLSSPTPHLWKMPQRGFVKPFTSVKSQYRDCYCKKCRAESSRLEAGSNNLIRQSLTIRKPISSSLWSKTGGADSPHSPRQSKW